MAEKTVTPVERKRYPTLPRLRVTRAGKISEPGAVYASTALAVAHARKMVRLDREEFWCLHLDAKNRLVGYEVIAMGSMTAAIIHPREVFKGLILNSAASVIFLHNHPSGDTTPSGEDLALTKRLYEAGELLGIRVLDHIIIGDSIRNFCSLADKGLLS